MYLSRLLSGQGIGVEQVEEWMQLSHLQKLMRAFQDHQPTRPHIPDGTPTYRRWELQKEQREPGLLNSDEFKAAVADVLGTNQFDDQLETLFTKVTMCSHLQGQISFYLQPMNGVVRCPMGKKTCIARIQYNV